MTRTVSRTSQPRITERISDGAKIVRPAARPRWIRNRNAARVRVLRSKRVSRYSYAVYTFNR